MVEKGEILSVIIQGKRSRDFNRREKIQNLWRLKKTT